MQTKYEYRGCNIELRNITGMKKAKQANPIRSLDYQGVLKSTRDSSSTASNVLTNKELTLLLGLDKIELWNFPNRDCSDVDIPRFDEWCDPFSKLIIGTLGVIVLWLALGTTLEARFLCWRRRTVRLIVTVFTRPGWELGQRLCLGLRLTDFVFNKGGVLCPDSK